MHTRARPSRILIPARSCSGSARSAIENIYLHGQPGSTVCHDLPVFPSFDSLLPSLSAFCLLTFSNHNVVWVIRVSFHLGAQECRGMFHSVFLIYAVRRRSHGSLIIRLSGVPLGELSWRPGTMCLNIEAMSWKGRPGTSLFAP